MKHYLETIKFGVLPIVSYKGVLVEKIIGGWKVLEKIVSTPEQVDKIINDSLQSLSKSVR